MQASECKEWVSGQSWYKPKTESLLFNLQKENADKEKEKEKQERIEASLREREREVRASQAELAKAREKEKEQHLRDKAEQHFNALLADMVRKNVIFLVIKVSVA